MTVWGRSIIPWLLAGRSIGMRGSIFAHCSSLKVARKLPIALLGLSGEFSVPMPTEKGSIIERVAQPKSRSARSHGAFWAARHELTLENIISFEAPSQENSAEYSIEDHRRAVLRGEPLKCRADAVDQPMARLDVGIDDLRNANEKRLAGGTLQARSQRKPKWLVSQSPSPLLWTLAETLALPSLLLSVSQGQGKPKFPAVFK
jgi:hypothetical protein